MNVCFGSVHVVHALMRNEVTGRRSIYLVVLKFDI